MTLTTARGRRRRSAILTKATGLLKEPDTFDHPGYPRLVAATVLAALVLTAPAAAFAQARYPDVPVLVAGEDENPDTIPRSHEIFQRVMAELKGVLSRAGFQVIEEAAVAVDLDWQIRDRRPRMDLIDLAKMMNRSTDATHGVRALVLFSVLAKGKSLYSRTRFRIRMNGAIYDMASNRFVDTSETEKSVDGPPGCRDDPGCISRFVGGRARELATAPGSSPPRSATRWPGSWRATAMPRQTAERPRRAPSKPRPGTGSRRLTP